MGPLADGSLAAPPSQAGRRTPRSLPEEPLDGILSPELDKMVTDGQCTRKTFAISFFFKKNIIITINNAHFSLSESILSKLYKIPGL